MRLTRIRLKDYRGIGEREIQLAPVGVTVVQGPNEIGKSSLAEGLDLLLEHFDDSRRKEIRQVQPVGRDVGPEVEVDMETGPYAFTYRKRFLRDRETVLDMRRPRPQSLTGREAHERVQAMLAETLDPSLWRALRVTQGAAISDVELGGIASLSAALDAVAGTTPVRDREKSLFERAHDEYGRYWTDTGRARGEAGALEQALATRRSELDQIEAALRKLEDDVEAVARLNGERSDSLQRRAQDELLVAELRESWRKVEGIQKQVEAADARLETARLATEQASAAVVAREALIAKVQADGAERDEWVTAVERVEPALRSTAGRVQVATTALAGATATRVAAEQALSLLRADIEHLADRAIVTKLREQRDRLSQAREGLTVAEAECAANKVSQVALEAVRAASVEVQAARARLEVGSPAVVVESLGADVVELDGQPLALAPGATEERSVIGQLHVEVPGAVRVYVSAGADGEESKRALATAESSFVEACREAGVEDLAAAEAAAVTRRDAAAARETHARTMSTIFEGLDLESAHQLDPRIFATEQRIEAYAQGRPSEPGLPPHLGTARTAVSPAESALVDARNAEEHARTEDEAARVQAAKVESAATEVRVHLKVAAGALTMSEEALARARIASSDDALAARHRAKEAAERTAASATLEARATLEEEGPGALRTRLENAQAVLAGSSQRLRDVEDELLAVQTRLRDHQEDGLAEQRDGAIVARDVAERELASHRRRAEARKLLYRTLKDARDEAHRTYIGPLRERIEELGRVVYGESFGVELSHDLRIANRTLDGDTVPFASLSIGTQEQLGVIARLACAIIVDQDEGAPLILDDTLGLSDPGRLEAMGAVLGLAGNACQVVALTCYPDRYRHVGGATVRRLG